MSRPARSLLSPDALAVAVIGSAVAAWAASLAAQSDAPGAGDDGIVVAGPDEPIGRRGPEVALELGLEVQRARGQDVLDADAFDSTGVQGDIGIAAEQAITGRVDLVGEVQLRSERSFESREDDDDDDFDPVDDEETTFRLRRLFVQHENAEETRRFRLGRQGIDDEMSWYVDEELDGLRHTRERGAFRGDLSLTRQNWFEAWEERDDIVYNALATLRIDGREDTTWVPWAMHRSARAFAGERASETTWFGLQGIVRIDERFGYWLNAASRLGTEERGDEDRDLGGGAVDVGLTTTFGDVAFEPSFTVGYAHATGDRDRGDGDDLNFRQTGLHSNEFAINGRNRFRYLGEVIDPELSNLEVVTLGVGVELARRWDADLAFHRYRQVRSDDSLRGSDLDIEPEGDERDLGSALDLVIGYERSDTLDVLGVLGLFEPGDAFAGTAERAWVARLEVEWDIEL